MALSIKIINENGIELNYHRLLGFSINFDAADGQIQLNVLSYPSKEARNKEKLYPELQTGITLNQPLLNYVDENFTRENLYNRLKQEDPRFLEAVDC